MVSPDSRDYRARRQAETPLSVLSKFPRPALSRYRAGIPWRDLPERFGDPIKIHTRFSRWAKSGVWKKLFEMLASDADNEYAMIDSTIVRAHQHSAGAQKKTAQTRRSGAAKAG